MENMNFLEVLCAKQEELCALTDEFMFNNDVVLGFNYHIIDEAGEYDMYIYNPFKDCYGEFLVDPVEYYGNLFLDNGYGSLTIDEIMKRISIVDDLIKDIESGKKPYIRSLQYSDGTTQVFENYVR